MAATLTTERILELLAAALAAALAVAIPEACA
jgi:hypothetical protein